MSGENIAEREQSLIEFLSSIENYDGLPFETTDETFQPEIQAQENICHVTNGASKGKSFICGVCDRGFASKFTLKRHKRDYCERMRTSKCSSETSNISTPTTNQPQQEQKLEFEQIDKMITTSYQCKVCQASFAAKPDVFLHIKAFHI